MQVGKQTLLDTTARTLVRNVEAFQTPELADIRDTFGHLSVGELRHAFSGISVDAIAALSKNDRAQFIAGYVSTKRGALDSVDSTALGAVLGFTGNLGGKKLAANAELIGLSKKDVAGASDETIRELGAEYLHTASTPELREVALAHLARETEALFGEIAKSIPETRPGQWSKTPNSTFIISTLPYEPTINRALEVAFEADRLGKTNAAIALYRSVLATDPENADALNRLSIALGHQAKKASGENVLAYAQLSLALTQKILANAQSAGIYDPEANRVSLPELRKLAGNPNLQGLVTATVKALYNRAFASVKLREYLGLDAFDEGKADHRAHLFAALTAGGLERTQAGDYLAHGVHPRTAKRALEKGQLQEPVLGLMRKIAEGRHPISPSELETLALRYLGEEARPVPTAEQTIAALRAVGGFTDDFSARAKEIEHAQHDAAAIEGLHHRMTAWIDGLAEKQAARMFEDLYREVGRKTANQYRSL